MSQIVVYIDNKSGSACVDVLIDDCVYDSVRDIAVTVGHKITAVKLVRKLYGISLIAAKTITDAIISDDVVVVDGYKHKVSISISGRNDFKFLKDYILD